MPISLQRAGRHNKELMASLGFEDISSSSRDDKWDAELRQALNAIRGAIGGDGDLTAEIFREKISELDAAGVTAKHPRKGGAEASIAVPAGDDNPNAATKLVIQCLKEGLAKSISSISHRQKDRPLNPRTDFTFKCCINFKERKVGRQRKTTRIRTREGDLGCCGGTIATKANPMDSNSDTPSDDPAEEDDDDSTSDVVEEESERMRELAAAADRPVRRSRAPSLVTGGGGMQRISPRASATTTPLVPPTSTGDGSGPFLAGGIRRIAPPPLMSNRPPPTQILSPPTPPAEGSHEPFAGNATFPPVGGALADVSLKAPPFHRRVMSYSMKYPMQAPDLEATLSSASLVRDSPPAHETPPPVHPAATTYLRVPSGTGTPRPTVDDRGPREAFTFTDYSPMCYRHIRTFFRVDAKEYRDVLCHSRWHSIPTPGKSAAQLFFCGQNWVIKTMTQEESKFLRAILHRYYNHVRDNPGTLLPHFVGHHSISINGEKITFVIMQNVFATPNRIDEKFDLKGSTVGRYVSEKEKRKKTCTKKDLDINRPINVGSERRAILIRQLEEDCLFLERCKIMDYSFLIGIHYYNVEEPQVDHVSFSPQRDPTGFVNGMPRSPGADGGGLSFFGASPKANRPSSHVDWGGTQEADTSVHVAPSPEMNAQVETKPPLSYECFTAFHGGMLSDPLRRGNACSNPYFEYNCGPSRHSHEIYYVGIIDILQEYNWWKRGETLVRRATNDVHQISSVDPHMYSARFVSFMSSIIT